MSCERAEKTRCGENEGMTKAMVGGNPPRLFPVGLEPLARVTQYLADKSALGGCFGGGDR